MWKAVPDSSDPRISRGNFPPTHKPKERYKHRPFSLTSINGRYIVIGPNIRSFQLVPWFWNGHWHWLPLAQILYGAPTRHPPTRQTAPYPHQYFQLHLLPVGCHGIGLTTPTTLPRRENPYNFSYPTSVTIKYHNSPTHSEHPAHKSIAQTQYGLINHRYTWRLSILRCDVCRFCKRYGRREGDIIPGQGNKCNEPYLSLILMLNSIGKLLNKWSKSNLSQCQIPGNTGSKVSTWKGIRKKASLCWFVCS